MEFLLFEKNNIFVECAGRKTSRLKIISEIVLIANNLLLFVGYKKYTYLPSF